LSLNASIIFIINIRHDETMILHN